MMDFLSFRRMLMPYLVQIVFWCGTALCIFTGVMLMFGKTVVQTPETARIGHGILPGLGVMILGPIVLRLVCENFIVIFRINETLTDKSGGGKKK